VIPGKTPSDPARLYVSGAAQGIVFAYDVDVAKKTLTRASDQDITVPAPTGKAGGLDGNYYFAGIAASPDGKKLFVATQNFRPASILVIDVDPTSTTFKTVLRAITVDGKELFMPYVAPADTTGSTVFVSVWDGARVDVFKTDDGSKITSIDVGKNPEAFTLIASRYLAVVSSDDDSIELIDTLATPPAKVGSTPVVSGSSPGWSPSGLAWDDANKRLYVTLAGLNVVAAFDVTVPTSGAPTLAASGMIATDWWPTAIALRDDGTLVVVDGKGKGTGPNPIAWKPSQGDITDRMKGSIQVIASPDAATLAAGKDALDKSTNVAALAGWPKVDCGGADYDFPIPETNTGDASKLIQHVVFVVKENKTFDGVYGDMNGVNGDASLVMAPGQMEIFENEQAIAKAFTNYDNYYTSAEQSIQGHVWTAYARTTDFTERTWLVTWGRGFRGLPPQGVIAVGQAQEGSIFDWLQKNKVLFDDMGELIGPTKADASGNGGYDPRYPGAIYTENLPDTVKSCYMAARARVSCDLKSFTYAVQPNDHTAGSTANVPTPAAYIAVGDEGLGILLEGLSKSPLWSSTLLIVTEDDPQDGGDHVDAHRTPLLMASPWIKRGYVAKGHYDVASIHKLVANIFAKPYPNEMVARASLPMEAFTSTPDFTPFDHLVRAQPLSCNPAGTKAATKAAMSGWDLSRPDEAPGIAGQIWDYFHPNGEAAPPADDDD
jgi:DNA-binding beta-propeller fold protein YncE